MVHTEQSIEIDAPVSVAYNSFTRFEDFPRFMEGIKSVKQLDDTHLHWVAELGGQTVEWDAEITTQTPDELIAWRSTSGAHNVGVISFEPLSSERCRITAWIEAEPEGVVQSLATAIGALDRRVKDDLERFAEQLTDHGADSGWRGSVAAGQVLERDTSEVEYPATSSDEWNEEAEAASGLPGAARL